MDYSCQTERQEFGFSDDIKHELADRPEKMYLRIKNRADWGHFDLFFPKLPVDLPCLLK